MLYAELVQTHHRPNWEWNVFDFCIVTMSMPFIPVGGAIAALRLVRLMRLVKLLNKIPKLRMLLQVRKLIDWCHFTIRHIVVH